MKFNVVNNEGRHAILFENISAGDIVLEELPYVIGPKNNSPIVCLECYRPVNLKNSDSKCLKCGWPLCNDCRMKILTYHLLECEVFVNATAVFNEENCVSSSIGCLQFDCITPLRILLKKESDPERWENELEPMEYHDIPRREATEIWNADLINVARYLRGPCKLNRFSEDLIMQVIGILEINAFEAKTPLGYPFRALYPTTAILAHSCVPNTARSIYPSEDYRVRLRATVDLKAGQQLNHSYTFTLHGTAARLKHLRNGKYFTCKCKRCIDPTELGTYFSSFKCNKCNSGMVSTSNPFDNDADWKCSVCDIRTPAGNIENLLHLMQSELDDVQRLEMNLNKLKLTEELYIKFSTILSPFHYMQTTLRQNLIELYGHVKGYEMASLSDKLLERKELLCREVLKVLNVFEPGLSRSRAVILYELHVPIVLLAKSQFIDKSLPAIKLKERLQLAIKYLFECFSILQNEDPQSQEGCLGRIAQQAMEHLSKSIETIKIDQE